MSPIIVGIIGFAIFFILIALEVPIGISMILVGCGGIWYLVSDTAAAIKLAIVPFSTLNTYDLVVLPLFIFMAHVCFVSGLSKDLYNVAAKWLGHQRGGLAMATVAGCAGFAAVSASSIATAATLGLVSIPEMKRYKYDTALATGSVAAGGTIGILIPPSGTLIIYGIITETSIGQLFMAGLVPGILEALFYMATIYILCLWKPHYGPRGPSYSLREKLASFSSCFEIIGLVIVVLGGLIIGWFTPSEAGAAGAFGAIVFSLLRKRLNWSKLKQALTETMKTTGMIFGILIGAYFFMPFVALTNIPAALADFTSGLPLPPLAIVGIILVIYIFLGCFLDVMAMILITVPIFFPLVLGLGFDAIWFGILLVRAMEIALITPPIGLNVYVIAGVAPDVPMQTIFKGIIPFLIADFIHVMMLVFVPGIILFLPSIMY